MAWPGTIYLEQPYAIQSSEPARSCSEKQKQLQEKLWKFKKMLKKERST